MTTIHAGDNLTDDGELQPPVTNEGLREENTKLLEFVAKTRKNVDAARSLATEKRN